MKKITLIIALAFFISSNAQNVTTNGTMLADDLTSRSRVVVDAFENSSNRVHELIETVSPRTSLEPATNYTDVATNTLHAQIDAGWWSEWEYSEVEGNITIDNILVVYAPPHYDSEGGGRWGAIVTTTEGNIGFYSSDYSDDDERVRLSGGEFGVSGSFTATRHRVAAPVPTKPSDIGAASTNDVQLTPVYGGNGERFSDWVIEPPIQDAYITWVYNGWEVSLPPFFTVFIGGDESSVAIEFEFETNPFTASRTENPIVGYTLGDQTTKPLQPKGDYAPATDIPTKTSDLTNDVGFVTSSITNGLASTNYVDSATNSLSKSLAPTITNIASTVSSSAIASADTTYRRTIGLTNLNQSVQYVNITDPAPTTLAISMPTDGATKDWMVYVVSVTNVTLSLPSATWWMADVAYTNDVPPATPTALWFSQVTDGVFILGRQELTEVTVP